MPSLRVTGRVVPLPRANVDTDLIIPARYMKTVTREGLGEGCFAALRESGDSVFDDPAYRGAPILAAGANFGCGSSREHAVWALQQIGIEAVVAPSFGEIFENNALRNGLLAIRVPEQEAEALLRLRPEQEVTVDVEAERLVMPDGRSVRFALDPLRKRCLVEGLDDIALTEAMEPAIAAFESRQRAEQPWMNPSADEEQP